MHHVPMCRNHQEWDHKSPDLSSLGRVISMIKNHEIDTSFAKKGNKGKEDKPDSRR